MVLCCSWPVWLQKITSLFNLLPALPNLHALSNTSQIDVPQYKLVYQEHAFLWRATQILFIHILYKFPLDRLVIALTTWMWHCTLDKAYPQLPVRIDNSFLIVFKRCGGSITNSNNRPSLEKNIHGLTRMLWHPSIDRCSITCHTQHLALQTINCYPNQREKVWTTRWSQRELSIWKWNVCEHSMYHYDRNCFCKLPILPAISSN